MAEEEPVRMRQNSNLHNIRLKAVSKYRNSMTQLDLEGFQEQPQEERGERISDSNLEIMRKALLEERLLAYREDLAEWFSDLFRQKIAEADFLSELENGVRLCQLAKLIEDGEKAGVYTRGYASPKVRQNYKPAPRTYNARPDKNFQLRDNVALFIDWCKGLGLEESVLFEVVDLIERKSEKNVLYSLMELARTQGGVPPPKLVQLERKMDAGTAQLTDQEEEELLHDIQVLLKRLGREDLSACRVRSGEYSIGGEGPYRMARLRRHIMVRLANTWDTLEHFLISHFVKKEDLGRIAAERTKKTEVKDQADTMDRRLSVSQTMARRQSLSVPTGMEPKFPRRSSILMENPPVVPDNDAELKRLKAQLEETTRQLNELKASHENLQKKLDEMQTRNRKLETERNLAVANADRMQETIKELERAAERARQSEGDVKRLGETVKRLEAEIAGQKAREERTNQDLKKKGEEADKQGRDLIRARSEAEGLAKKLDDAEKKLRAAQSEFLESRSREAGERASAQKAIESDLKARIAELERQLREQKAEQAKMKRDLEAERDALEERMETDAEARIKEVTDRLNNLAKAVAAESERALSKKEDEAAAERKAAREAEASAASLRDKCAYLQDQLNDAQKMLDDASRTNSIAEALNDRVEELMTEIERLRQENEALRRENAALVHENGDLRSKQLELEDERRALERDLGTATDRIGRLESELQRAQRDKERDSQRDMEVEQHLKAETERADREAARAADLQHQLHEKEDELAQAQFGSREAQDAIQLQAAQKLMDAARRVEEVEEEAEKRRTEYEEATSGMKGKLRDMQDELARVEQRARAAEQALEDERRRKAEAEALQPVEQTTVIERMLHRGESSGGLRRGSQALPPKRWAPLTPQTLADRDVQEMCALDEEACDANLKRLEARMSLADAEKRLQQAKDRDRVEKSRESALALANAEKARDDAASKLAEADRYFDNVVKRALARLQKQEEEEFEMLAAQKNQSGQDMSRRDTLVDAHSQAQLRIAQLERRLGDAESSQRSKDDLAKWREQELQRVAREAEEQKKTDQQLINELMARLADLEASANSDLDALRAEVAQWINTVVGANLPADHHLLDQLRDGITLCELANIVDLTEEDVRLKEEGNGAHRPAQGGLLDNGLADITDFIRSRPLMEVDMVDDALPGTPAARSNIEAFVAWARNLGLENPDVFEVDDLAEKKNERAVLSGILDVARHSRGLPLPASVERERNAAIRPSKYDAIAGDDVDQKLGEVMQKNPDLSGMFQRISKGRYLLGKDRKVYLMRVMRERVMVRVGGGWEDLERFLLYKSKQSRHLITVEHTSTPVEEAARDAVENIRRAAGGKTGLHHAHTKVAATTAAEKRALARRGLRGFEDDSATNTHTHTQFSRHYGHVEKMTPIMK